MSKVYTRYFSYKVKYSETPIIYHDIKRLIANRTRVTHLSPKCALHQPNRIHLSKIVCPGFKLIPDYRAFGRSPSDKAIVPQGCNNWTHTSQREELPIERVRSVCDLREQADLNEIHGIAAASINDRMLLSG